MQAPPFALVQVTNMLYYLDLFGVAVFAVTGVTSSQLTEHLLLEIFGFLVCESILARCQIA